jgi:hypothetical protein
MKKLINVLFFLFVFSNATSKDFSEQFNKTFTNTKEVTLFCGDVDQVSYFMGYHFNLLPVSLGEGYDIFEGKRESVFLAASSDFTTIAILILNDNNELCVSSISMKHKLYNKE